MISISEGAAAPTLGADTARRAIRPYQNPPTGGAGKPASANTARAIGCHTGKAWPPGTSRTSFTPETPPRTKCNGRANPSETPSTYARLRLTPNRSPIRSHDKPRPRISRTIARWEAVNSIRSAIARNISHQKGANPAPTKNRPGGIRILEGGRREPVSRSHPTRPFENARTNQRNPSRSADHRRVLRKPLQHQLPPPQILKPAPQSQFFRCRHAYPQGHKNFGGGSCYAAPPPPIAGAGGGRRRVIGRAWRVGGGCLSPPLCRAGPAAGRLVTPARGPHVPATCGLPGLRRCRARLRW